MMKYVERGLGNTWFLRTETELEDGTEFEAKGELGVVSQRETACT